VTAPEYILTLDLGTTASKATLFSMNGAVAAQANIEYPTLHPEPAAAEQEPSAWWDAAVRGCAALPHDARRRVVAVGLSSQRGGVVPMDADLRPLARCVIWMDRRSASEVDAFVRAFGRERVHEVTGLVPDTEFSAGKILWLRSHAPDVFRAARVYLQPRDYLYLRLTGRLATDFTLASRTLLLDVTRRTWWHDAFAYVGITPDAFPPVYASTTAPHTVCRDAAAALGIPQGVPAALGGGDRPCEALGAAAVGGRVMVSTGTTTNVSAASSGAPTAPDPRVMYSLHVVDGQYLLEQGMSASGSILRWLRDTLLAGGTDYGRIDALAGAVPPGSNGLVFLPFMMGARATRWDPDARGAWFGLRESHGLGELARSIMEGVACEVRACVGLLQGMGVRPREMVAVGGGARSALWDQILADVLGRPVAVPHQTDAASLGAMLLAAVAIGRLSAVEDAAHDINPAARAFVPIAAAATHYDGLYGEYNRLYEALRPEFHERRGGRGQGE
jgi:xylulokinase